MNETAARLRRVEAQIAASALAAGRAVSGITLIAVSKTFPAEAIIPALDAGHRVYGENRVQETSGKWPPLQLRYPQTQLHLIGPLQSNKARDAVELFDAIHTLDRESLAAALHREIGQTGRRPDLFVQVNTGLEPQKSGVAPAEVAAFTEKCRAQYKLPVVGLMCLPPEEEEPAVHFALLAKLAHVCGLGQLSMGMSGDFETAIAFGATHIRVGSAIFGNRPAH